MQNVRWQRGPWSAHFLFPNRLDGRREIPVVETPDRYTKLIWTQIKVPTDGRSASRTEVGVHPAPLRSFSGIDFVLPFEPNLRLREIGVTR